MTLRECIDKVDGLKPNQYSVEEKVKWLASLESNIYTDIILSHEFKRDDQRSYEPYTTEDMDVEMIAKFPYDEVYVAYLKMKIDEENQETARYNNSASLFNAHLDNFAKYINKTHRPKNHAHFRFY